MITLENKINALNRVIQVLGGAAYFTPEEKASIKDDIAEMMSELAVEYGNDSLKEKESK
jgi:hypothetical protein